MTTTTERDAQVLAVLADADGAMLAWQACHVATCGPNPAEAFADALARGVIRLDADSDCYVHPHAVPVEGGGFTLDEDAIADAVRICGRREVVVLKTTGAVVFDPIREKH